jgi:hypothetical protein
MMRNRITTAFVLAGAIVAMAGCKGAPSGGSVEVKIAIQESTPRLKAATIVVDYQRSGATVEMKGGGPACASILPHVTCRFRNDGDRLMIDVESPQGFSGPADLAVCRMIPAGSADSADSIAAGLRVTLLDPRGADGQPVTIAAAPRPSSDDSSPPAPAQTRSDDLSHGEGSSAGQAGAGTAAPGSRAPASGGGQGMVVTREDLQRRERQRAEEELARRRADDGGNPILGGGSAGSGRASGESGDGRNYGAGDGREDELPAEEPGTGKNDPTDDDASATEYGVRFDLASTSAPLGALQFDVDYHGGSGGWLGAGGGADCRWLIQAALHACNDKRGGSLTCALVDTNGFAGPTALMECSFKSRNSVAAGDFAVRVTDASDPALNPADARVIVSGVYAR